MNAGGAAAALGIACATLSACGTDAGGPTGPGPGGPPSSVPVQVTITPGDTSVRQGDVVAFAATARYQDGSVRQEDPVAWTIVPSNRGMITADGRIVGYAPGEARLVATIAGRADTVELTVLQRGITGHFRTIGRGPVADFRTSDLWVHGDAAYTGSYQGRISCCGDVMYVWDISDPAAPVLTDSVRVAARRVNDVKVRADGAIAVITHELDLDLVNGITLLDLSDPLHPEVLSRFTAGFDIPGDVHNVWIEGDYVYAAQARWGSLHVVDITDPTDPVWVTSYHAGLGLPHDVYVRDGLAFVSHWEAGLIILDVGNGIAGGVPTSPVEVGGLALPGVEVHSAWYWPATGYVFLGDETSDGRVWVVDATDLREPVVVASYAVFDRAPHNFWLDEERAILYSAWFEGGVRAMDVSGVLLGELERQGRGIAVSTYDGVEFCWGPESVSGTCPWAPQLHNGLVYVADLNTGLWILEPTFEGYE